MLDDQPGISEQLCQSGCRVKANAVLPPAGSRSTSPGRLNRQQTRQGVELALLREHCIARCPPVALEKPRHDAIPASSVPDEYASRLQHARKFTNHAQVVRRMRKEAERGKEIQHRIEPPGPPSRQLAH